MCCQGDCYKIVVRQIVRLIKANNTYCLLQALENQQKFHELSMPNAMIEHQVQMENLQQKNYLLWHKLEKTSVVIVDENEKDINVLPQ